MYFSLEAFPDNPPLKDESGLPWGCSIQPFYQLEQKTENGESMKPLKLETIGRCSKCFGYINSFVRWSRKSWTCPLCYNVNDISQHPRYKFVDSRKDCEELLHTVMEYVVPNEKSEENFSLHPLFVAIADATADPDTLEIIKEGLKAVIEGLKFYVNCLLNEFG